MANIADASHRADTLLARATIDELISLLAGADFWHTEAIERLGIPAMRLSDGPAGVRGTQFVGPASLNVPCGTALAATWDPHLVASIGELLGEEAAAKGASVVLAPTVNLHRTPIGGRNFECMSEDPTLTAGIAVAYIRGLQANGVASCVKHFVGNDTEFERMSIDSRIDQRTLRELYLVPFEAAVEDAQVQAVMTAYNRINGPFSADSELIEDVLRGEWGFDGVVVSDWFGMHSTVEALIAGTDLEMPGPTRHRGTQLRAALDEGLVTEEQIRTSARRILALMAATGALDAEGPGPETTRDDPVGVDLIRRTAAQSMVVVRNEIVGDRPVLPLADGLRRVAVIGPNAAVGQIMGGGSAHVTPTVVSHPLAALTERLTADVVHAAGCSINRRLPTFDLALCEALTIDFFLNSDELDDAEARPAKTSTLRTTQLMWIADPLERSSGYVGFGARLRTVMTPDVSGTWQFGVESVGDVRVIIGGVEILDNTGVAPGGSFFGAGKPEVTGGCVLEAGRSVEVIVELRQPPGSGVSSLPGLNIGLARPTVEDPIGAAVELARSAEVSIVVVGTNDDWESEGWDRETIDLPGQQNELVERVAAASRATIVVINAGSPVAMPWLDQVDAVVVAWFPGQEMGNALADVLTGAVNPIGRLPVTFPRDLADTPAFEHSPGRNGVAHYAEGRLVGYRWYDTVGRQPLFPFGHGLSYWRATIDEVVSADGDQVVVRVSNKHDRPASEVIQVYAHRNVPVGDDQPEQWLVGFAKVTVPPKGSLSTTVALDRRAWRSWDLAANGWRSMTGTAELRVARSSDDVVHRVTINL